MKAPKSGSMDAKRRARAFLDEARRQLKRAGEERRLFGLDNDPRWEKLSGPLEEAVRRVASAFSGRAAWDRLAQAKAAAAAAELASRRAARGALNEPNTVSELKARAVCRRISDAAEALQKAADALAEGKVHDA